MTEAVSIGPDGEPPSTPGDSVSTDIQGIKRFLTHFPLSETPNFEEIECASQAVQSIVSAILADTRQNTTLLSILHSYRKSRRFHVYVIAITALRWLELRRTTEPDVELFLACVTYLLNVNRSDEALRHCLLMVPTVGTPKFDPKQRLRLLSMTATAYRNTGEHLQAIEMHEYAYRSSDTPALEQLRPWELFRIGKLLVNYLYQPSRAAHYLQKARVEFEGTGNIKGVCACLDELGDVYRESTYEIERAKEFYERAYKLNERIDNDQGVSRNLAHLGLCALARQDLVTADRLLERSIDILRQIPGQARAVGVRLGQLAQLKLSAGDETLALTLVREARRLSSAYNDYRSVCRHLLTEARLLRMRHQLAESLACIVEASDLARSTKRLSILGELLTLESLLRIELFDDYEAAKRLTIEATQFRLAEWRMIVDTSPSLEAFVNEAEPGQLYKDLFKKLYIDFEENVGRVIGSLDRAFESALRERESRSKIIEGLLFERALSTGMRHEVGNSLNNSLALTSRLRKAFQAGTSSEETRRLIEQLRLEIRSGVNCFQRTSKAGLSLEHHDRQVIDIVPSLEHVIAGMRPQAEDAEVIIKTTIGGLGQIHQIRCSEDIFRVVVRNIVKNALDALRHMGRNDRGPCLTVSAWHSSPGVTIVCIEDNGPGMTASQCEIATRFGGSTKPDHEGIGIPTSRVLMELIGGSLSVESELDQFTKIVLTFQTAERDV
jgi:signal transduction histidine kinase